MQADAADDGVAIGLERSRPFRRIRIHEGRIVSNRGLDDAGEEFVVRPVEIVFAGEEALGLNEPL